MKIIYCIKCTKYRKSRNPTNLCIFYKTLVLSIICDDCGSKDETTFKEEE